MSVAALVGVLFCAMCVMVTCASVSGCPEIRNGNGTSRPVITDNSSADDVMLYSQDQPLTLSCCVRGHPKPNITWLKDNRPLLLLEGLQLRNDNQELRFGRLLPVNSGEYTCIAKNSYGASNYTIYMDIRIEPGRDVLPPLVAMDKSWKAVVGSNITLVCRVSSYGYTPVVAWSKAVNTTLYTYLPSNPSKRGSGLQGKYISTLTIKNVSSKDAGVYRCQAKNGAGNTVPEKEGRLTVVQRKEETVSAVTSAPAVNTRVKTHKFIAAVGGGLALLVIILFVVALVYIKRHKPEGWLTRKLIQMGVVNPRRCHAETHGEHGDDACSCSITWDVFVSCDSEDREWVTNVLYKELTNAYKVCIDVPGGGVVDNTARCIWRSNTTLFVVSRDFLRSGWSKMEFEITQDKIRQTQGSLVVIMLEDIKWQELPPILRRYTTGKMRVDCKDKQLQPKAWRRLRSLLGPSIDPKENADAKETPMTATGEEEYRLLTFTTSVV